MKTRKRTDIDFSYYEVIVEDNENLLVHTIKRKNYEKAYSIKFINTNGVMAVTGDYGNWIFCREFHPDKDTFASDGYWIEKLSYASSQEGEEFDFEATKKEIELGIKSGLEDYGYTGDELESMKEFYTELLEYVEDSPSEEYRSYAYNNMPSFCDTDYIPYVQKNKPWLDVVFDGFDEICRRLKK